jgi:dipeptidyl aminopeptidase/acylaminoacyl peptidase
VEPGTIRLDRDPLDPGPGIPSPHHEGDQQRSRRREQEQADCGARREITEANAPRGTSPIKCWRRVTFAAAGTRLRTMRPVLGFLAASSLLVAAACSAARPSPSTAAVAPPAPAPAVAAATAPVSPDVWAPSPATAELEQRAAAFVDAYPDDQPVFTHDGKRIVFVSSRSGLPQLYVADVDKPALPPRRLMEWPDTVRAALVTWDDKSVVFASDHQGDEQMRFFRIPIDGGAVEPLTPDSINRDYPCIPERARDRVFFSGRAMDGARTQIFSTSLLRPGPATSLYQDEGVGFLLDVSQDGRKALFARFRTHQDNPVVVIDLEKGTARPLYPKQGEATVRSASFSPDGRRAYVLTDGGGEQALMLALDVESGAELGRYVETSPVTATPEMLAVSRQGDTIAVGLDAGDRSEMRLIDARTMRLRARVDLPLGRGHLSALSDDGTALALSWSTPDHPSELFSVSTATGVATPLRKEPRPGLEGMAPVKVSNVSVPSFDGLKIPVNVYLPSASGRRPVIVHLHGGPAGAASIGWSPLTKFFLSQGYAWVEPNIRGSGNFGRSFEAADDGHKRLDSFRDIDAVRAWVGAQPWADPEQLIVYGPSFGGYLVLHELVTHPGAWRAGIDSYGIADFKTFLATTTAMVLENYKHELGDPVKDRDFLEEISPLRQVDRIAVPFFVYAGANDPRVPRAQADAIVGAARARKIPVEYMLGENEGHGITRRENQIAFQVRVARFLERVREPARTGSR